MQRAIEFSVTAVAVGEMKALGPRVCLYISAEKVIFIARSSK